MTAITRRRNVHPFPARMAPDVALAKINALTRPDAIVLDPMCGSGTVPRLAANEGRRALACDVDPLAVLITRTACKPDWSRDLAKRVKLVVDEAQKLDDRLPHWIAGDQESHDFIEYWFAVEQRAQLCRLARVLSVRPTTDDPLRVALSRLIVTKDGGASLARDAAHSRPHRVRTENDFDVYGEFLASAKRLEEIVGSDMPQHRARIRSVDARHLYFIEPSCVDLIVTSPPYLNAIDYLRGHRLSLVWFGWTLSTLRELRGESIGSERSMRDAPPAIVGMAELSVPRITELSQRYRHIIYRFTSDIDRLCRSLARVSKVGGHMVFVVADSQLRGVPVENSAICRIAAQRHGFAFQESVIRPLPAQHRYLPPPEFDRTSLGGRMREEAVLTFERIP